MEIVHVDVVIEHGAIKGEIVNYRRCARFFFKCLYIIRFYVYYVGFFFKTRMHVQVFITIELYSHVCIYGCFERLDL